MPKKKEPEVTDGGARRRPDGVGWSGPSQSHDELAERGAKKFTLYLGPEKLAQVERLRLALRLPEQRFLGALWEAAAQALEEKLAGKKGEAEKGRK